MPGSTSRGELFEKHLAVEKIEQELALAVRQEVLVDQLLDPVAPDVLEDGAIIEKLRAGVRILDVEIGEDRRVEPDLPPRFHDRTRHDVAHRIAEHVLRLAVLN